jgi:hypothetical protein
MGGRMNSIGSEHASEGVSAKRLFVLQTAPDHPLSAPDPHLTLKLRDAELQHVSGDASSDEADEHESPT